MRSKTVEMNFDQFMSRYMPGPDLPPESVLNIPDFDEDKLMMSENHVCVELCRIAQVILDGCPGEEKLVAKNTRDHPDSSDYHDYAEQLRVDVSFYPTHGDATADYALPHESSKQASQFRASTRWAWISLLVEIKTVHDQCAFEFENKSNADGVKESATEDNGNARSESRGKGKDKATDVSTNPEDPTNQADNTKQRNEDDAKPKPFTRPGKGATKALAQMAQYAAKLFRRQHRLHLFTLFVFQGQARVIRWDRAGAIVSTPIDFKKEPSLLHQVIWRYASMDQVGRGFDPTVVRATDDEVAAMRRCEGPAAWVNQARDNALGQPGWPVYKIKMRTNDRIDQQGIQPLSEFFSERDDSNALDESERPTDGEYFIVGRRHFATDSPTGRGTRGYIAYDVSRKRLVFLKDYWRAHIKSSTPEGEVLRLMRSNGVRNVPTPIAAGVVQDDAGVVQETRTQAELPPDQRTKCPSPTQEHYRLVVKEIGQRLDEHESPKELVEVMFDALSAHKQAWELTKLLHRDISAGNILIYRFTDINGRLCVIGLLIDWDLCKFQCYLETVSRPARSGTWQFMSARLLSKPGKRHEVADDLESFTHVLNWMCFRFCLHRLSEKCDILKTRILALYEEQGVQNGDENKEEIGGELKRTLLYSGNPAVELENLDTPLSELLKDLASMCRKHYLAVDGPALKPKPRGAVAVGDASRDARSEKYQRIAAAHRSANAGGSQEAPVETGAETLKDHEKMYGAFACVLAAPSEQWDEIKRTTDRFQLPEFKKSPVYQHSTEQSSRWSSGSKRSLEGESADLARPGPSKRLRSSTRGLQSLEEEAGAQE
ncbi:uncharacterized protein C8Q71DRAFT_119192 [Rhodofomes roseus]|uniref:Fungal-type protein kinase domain-containing protein n=1 Tax=Rhodofomes roseus TaxID=34475 RepID=A0ABQ8KCU4_9APHY|nr:uncharacterized protein C8Q71DRAFT_119192 [Rhodofomes roseus]KAH9835418.1 hypothetical protein C8Q71DRAFT_119192 [Rhodofomes roseus]